jgi:DNA-binding LacI/PurR family transcriptional regulator
MSQKKRHEWTKDAICQDLRRRILMKGFLDQQFPGEGQLSRHYGVSVRAARQVRSALMAEGLLAPEKGYFTRILPGAMEALRARPLLTQIMMVAWHIRNESYPFAHHVASGANSRAVVRHIAFQMSRLSPEEGERRIEQIRQQAGMPESTGWIVLFSRWSKEFLENWLLQQVPFVIVDSVPSMLRVNAVAFDFEHTVFQATEHLIKLGHRAIGCIGPIQDAYVSRSRQAGLRAALERHGLSLPEEWIGDDLLHEGPNRGSNITGEVVRRVLSGNPRPTGLVCFSIRGGNEVLETARAMDIAVPEELSVISAGPLYYPGMMPQGGLTHVTEGRPEQLGELAVDLLMRPEAMVSPVPLLLRGHLVEGKSTAPPPAG